MFVKLSTFSFGGGYVMIPIMLSELEKNRLIDVSQVTDIVAIAGMSPGPVALNAAVGLGYRVAGFQGALASALGILIPNFIIVILAAMFFFKIYKSKHVTSAFYGLRPVVTGIILYAAISLALKNGIFAANTKNLMSTGYNIIVNGVQIFEVKSMILIIGSFLTLFKTKIHPIYIIISCAIVGTVIF
jgi:chromate transporter